MPQGQPTSETKWYAEEESYIPSALAPPSQAFGTIPIVPQYLKKKYFVLGLNGMLLKGPSG